MGKANKDFDLLNKKIDYLTDRVIDLLDEINRKIKPDQTEEHQAMLAEQGVQSIRIASTKETNNE
tara:strand:+ start:378 stop:572 length:195 start_codon:yes stop_codon:yes gene_type:complete